MLQSSLKNLVLRRLPPEDFKALSSLLEPVPLKIREVIATPGVALGFVHFPESGILSMIAVAEDGKAIEVGLVGREGASEQVLDSGSTRYAEVHGSARRIFTPR